VIDVREQLTDDAAAVLMLCSRLGLRADGESRQSPLTLREWNLLARKIHDSEVKRPGALLGISAADIAKQLEVPDVEAEKLVTLLDRGGAIALELEQLSASGIWCVTRIDESYPARLKKRLKHQSPPVLFGAGDSSILDKRAIGVVGSRNVDEAGAGFARRLGEFCGRSSVAVVSGGARGTDLLAMQGVLETDGWAVGMLADSLNKTIRQADVRDFISRGRLVLLTPYQPDSGFSIGAAMGRNKLIYGASDFAVVVSSELQKGGTWAGATEALKAGWCPLFVRSGKEVGPGNQELIKKGGRAVSDTDLSDADDIIDWMTKNSQSSETEPEQAQLSFA
jgi:predicted Rossmann fold nucleotide-binding protein DprA/Smf involved in DNA uptake